MAEDAKAGGAGRSEGIGKYARELSQGPLGLALAGLLLVEAIAGIVGASVTLSGFEKELFIGFVLLFPVLVLGFVFYMWRFHTERVFPPAAYKDDETYLKLIAPKVVTPIPDRSAASLDATVLIKGSVLGGNITISDLIPLFKLLADIETWDYLVIDVGPTEPRWLVSRLFIFTLLLQQVRGLRCIVFVETTDDTKMRLLGIARSGDVRSALGKRYPWLETALAKTISDLNLPMFLDHISLGQARDIMDKFVNSYLQTQEDKKQDPEWIQLESSRVWEHSSRLDAIGVRRDLGGVLFETRASTVEVSPDASDTTLLSSLMKCQTPYVARINSKHEFVELYDRESIVSQVAQLLGAVVRQDQGPRKPTNIKTFAERREETRKSKGG